MMEKRNFVTSARTPMQGAADVDDILEAASTAFGRHAKCAAALEKKASEEDEKTDTRA